MRAKQLLIPGIILIVLILGLVIKLNQKPKELATEEFSSLNLTVETAKVSAVQITKGAAAPVELQKVEGRWQVTSLLNARANIEKITSLLNEFQQLTGELRGQSKDIHNDFGIADDKAFGISLRDASGKELLSVKLGTKKIDYSDIFIRKSGSDNVYMTRADILGKMGVAGELEKATPTSDFWAATDFLVFDPSTIQKIESVRYKDGREQSGFSLIRESSKADPNVKIWNYTTDQAPFIADAGKINDYLNAFKSWGAQKVEDPKSKDFGFSKPTWKLTITHDSGEVVFTAGKPEGDGNQIPIQISGEPVVFSLAKYYLENYDKNSSDFYADNILNVDLNKVDKLHVKIKDKIVSQAPKEKIFTGLTAYLQDVKRLRVVKMITDVTEQKRMAQPAEYSIEVVQDGKSTKIEVGPAILPGKDAPNEDLTYLANLVGTKHYFTISNYLFKQLFENIERLNTPAEPKLSPAPPAS